MPNEFIFRNGFVSLDNSRITGSLTVSQGITGSLFGTSSWSQNVSTASYVLNALSASQATTASSADDFFVRQNLTASNLFITGSTVLSGSTEMTGSVTFSYIAPGPTTVRTFVFSSSDGILLATGSLLGTSSLSISSSFTTSASFARTASFAISASQAVSASFARTASFAISSSFATTSSFTITSSFATTASFAISSSFTVTTPTISVISSSFALTASFSPTASFVSTASFAITASSTTSASLARTASFLNIPLNQDIIITGSLNAFSGSPRLQVLNPRFLIEGTSQNNHILTGQLFFTGSLLAVTGSVKFSSGSTGIATFEYSGVNGQTILSKVASDWNYASDAAAAAGGVPLGGIYRDGNQIRIRVT